MRILCLNCWGGACGASLVDYLVETDADIFCLQEITRSQDHASTWQTYRDGGHVLRQRSSLFDEIASALPDHLGHFAPAARGTLFDAVGRALPSDWGIAIFVRNTLTLLAQQKSFIHGSFSPDGWGDHPRSRSVQGVRVRAAHGSALTVVNLHGLRDPAGKHDTPARLAQAARLGGFVRELAEAGDRIVVCGDFNVLPDSSHFDVLERLGLRDLVRGGGYSDTRTSHYTKQTRFADYMLVSRDLVVGAFDVVKQPEVSDHRPLLLKIEDR